MKNQTIVRILRNWGIFVLVSGTLLPIIFVVVTFKTVTIVQLGGLVFVFFSSLIGSAVFLAISRILLMVAKLYEIKNRELENCVKAEKNSI